MLSERPIGMGASLRRGRGDARGTALYACMGSNSQEITFLGERLAISPTSFFKVKISRSPRRS